MNWTTPDDLKKKLRTSWERGVFFRADFETHGHYFSPGTNEPDAPDSPDAPDAADLLRFSLKGPGASEMLSSFDAVRTWAGTWLEHAEQNNIQLEWIERTHRQLGRNRIPRAAVFSDIDAIARYISRQNELRVFRKSAEYLLARFSLLADWISAHPFALAENARDLESLADLTDWYLAHQRPGIYLRQVAVPGVHTKFIERHRLILGQWWTILCSGTDAYGPSGFERADGFASGQRLSAVSFARRFGFLDKPDLVRFRILDPLLTVGGFTDISVTADEFAARPVQCVRVLIIENDITVLSLPRIPGAIAVYGRGYGFESLARASWLAEKEIWYWGDIDTHGFAILDQLRASFPKTRSFLMDETTFVTYRSRWVTEPDQVIRDLPRLENGELLLYRALCSGTYGQQLRLEQELLPWDAVLSATELLQ